MISSDLQFTIEQNPVSTGKAHLVVVKCDLCLVREEFDPKKFRRVNDGVRQIIDKHVCKKGKRPDKQEPFEWEEPSWGENDNTLPKWFERRAK